MRNTIVAGIAAGSLGIAALCNSGIVRADPSDEEQLEAAVCVDLSPLQGSVQPSKLVDYLVSHDHVTREHATALVAQGVAAGCQS